MTLKLNILILMLYNDGVRLSLKNIHGNVSKGISLSLCFELSIRMSFVIRTGDCNIQKGKIISKNCIFFMTLNSWGKKHEAHTDEEEFGEDMN